MEETSSQKVSTDLTEMTVHSNLKSSHSMPHFCKRILADQIEQEQLKQMCCLDDTID